MMNKVIVMDGQGAIGSGYLLNFPDGGFKVAALTDLLGNEMPPGHYDLRPTTESFLVVVPDRIQ